MMTWLPLDWVARGSSRKMWIRRIASGDVEARVDSRTGACFVWAPADSRVVGALLDHGPPGELLPIERVLPDLLDRLRTLPKPVLKLSSPATRRAA